MLSNNLHRFLLVNTLKTNALKASSFDTSDSTLLLNEPFRCFILPYDVESVLSPELRTLFLSKESSPVGIESSLET